VDGSDINNYTSVQAGLASAAQLREFLHRPLGGVSGIHANRSRHTYTHEAFVGFVSPTQHRSAGRSGVGGDICWWLRRLLAGGAVDNAVELRGGTLQQRRSLLSETSDGDIIVQKHSLSKLRRTGGATWCESCSVHTQNARSE